jgi:hypothetical protein
MATKKTKNAPMPPPRPGTGSPNHGARGAVRTQKPKR